MTDIFPGASLVQLVEWGFPTGVLRPTPSPSQAYSVIHWTANTASAQQEAAWRRNDPGFQNSATVYVNPDGSVVQTLGDPLGMAPWTNGDPSRPDLSNPRIAAVVAAGVNPNYRSLITIELVADPGHPITPAQEATGAALIRYYHAKAGLAISRQTVIGHDQITATTCPGYDKAVVDRIVALAAGQGADMTDTDNTLFLGANGKPEPRPVDFLAGPVRGYHRDGSGKDFVIGAGGSWARADARCAISGRPDAPVGSPFVRMVDGMFADSGPWYVYEDGAKVKARPDPAPSGGITQAKYDADVAKAAMDAKVAAAKAGAQAAAQAAVDFADSLP